MTEIGVSGVKWIEERKRTKKRTKKIYYYYKKKRKKKKKKKIQIEDLETLKEKKKFI